MGYYVGLDVSLNTVFVCIVDEKNKVVREQEVPSTPEAIGGFLLGTGLDIIKIGLESGNLTPSRAQETKTNFLTPFLYRQDLRWRQIAW